MKKRPNILYIHSHDTGRYIQPYGHAISTPNLQELAEGGVLFRQCFTASPTCSPSRACLLTGQSAHNNGMLGLAHRGFVLYDYRRHLLHTLRKYGYFSALSGVQHIARGPDAVKTIGYDQCLTLDPEKAHINAVQFLEHSPKEPFFLSVGFFETHREFPEEHPRDDSRYCLVPSPLPDSPVIREDMARFKESVRRLDEKMGMVFQALECNGLADNTLIICTTDHGIAFPRMKCNLEDSGTGVMLIMRGPFGFTGGKVVEAMVSQIDIFPTICECLGIDKPEWLEGNSFLPVINGKAERCNEAIFMEVNYHAAFEPMRAVRTDRYKYIVRYDDRQGPVLPNCDQSLSKDVWLKAGWEKIPPSKEALYDLIFDPNEKENLATSSKHTEVLQKMQRRLKEWQKRTNDPLLSGNGEDLPLPETARLNSCNGKNPDSSDFLPPGKR